MEGGSVVANRVESEEYRELTSYEVFVCRGGGGFLRILQSLRGDWVNFIVI